MAPRSPRSFMAPRYLEQFRDEERRREATTLHARRLAPAAPLLCARSAASAPASPRTPRTRSRPRSRGRRLDGAVEGKKLNV